MNKKIKNTTILIASVLCFFISVSCAYAATEVADNVSTPTTWKKKNSPYIILRGIEINAPLSIESGVVVKFKTGISAGMLIRDSITASGTPSDKIVFTSVCDYAFGGDTSAYCQKTSPALGDWGVVRVYNVTQPSIFDNVLLKFGTAPIFVQNDNLTIPFEGITTIKNTVISKSWSGIIIKNTVPILDTIEFSDNATGLEIMSNNNSRVAKISNSSFVGNGVSIKVNFSSFGMPVDARNNWWGDSSGPTTWRNPGGKGSYLEDNYVLFAPWLTQYPNIGQNCSQNCNSNVLFLPGIKASRLYKDGEFDLEDTLWPPNYFGNDITNLLMRTDGSSIEHVYTRDVLDEVGAPVVGGNIYKSFLNNLAYLKSNGVINDYRAYAYDWRMSVEDIAKNGAAYPYGEVRSAIAQIETLANSSKSGKVTLIAHSNGGLLAKAIMLELNAKDLNDKVDKIIFVGTPQAGTPLAILSLLYGYDESLLFGSLMSRAEARELATNMPGAYGLLPSKTYLERLEDPLVTFSSSHTEYKKYIDAYGSNITDLDVLRSFLLAKEDGRTTPENDSVDEENVLNEKILDTAIQLHEKLDTWVPPENVQVYQIAGWGLDTVSGVSYTEKEKFSCTGYKGVIPICKKTGMYEPIYEPKFTVDGDKVVTAPSAFLLSEASNVKRYWIDLWSENKGININREHKNLLEIYPVIQFINNLIQNKTDSVENFYASRPQPDGYYNQKPRIRMSLYSPLDIHLYDTSGNHTGPKSIIVDEKTVTIYEEGIPNTYYYQIGDRKYVGFPEGEQIRVSLHAYGEGVYSLKLEEIEISGSGENTLSHVTFENLPTTSKAKIEFEIPKTGLKDISALEADMNNDGKTDYEVEKIINGKTTIDFSPPTISITSPEQKTYINDEYLGIDYSVYDDQSGIKEKSISLDGKIFAEEKIDLSLLSLGEHEFSVYAKDGAGNEARAKISFVLESNILAISKNILHYNKLGFIEDSTLKFLQEKTNELAHVFAMINKFDNKADANPKENQGRLLNKKVDALIDFVENKLGNNIQSPAREILNESLNFIKTKYEKNV